MRILWLGNPPWVGSGYGEQAGLFLPRFRALGHEVAVMCNWGLMGKTWAVGDLPVYPSDGQWGNYALATYADDFRAEQIIALCDAWVLEPERWPESLRAAVWAPVDHYPIPPPVLKTLGHERIQPIAMSRFAEALMKQAELDPIYVPHAVDTTLFRPQPGAREIVREQLGIPPDVFLVGMVAANKSNPSIPRKGFPQAFLAFSRFSREHEDVWLYCHSEAKPGPGQGGIALDTLAEVSGCPPGRVRFPEERAWQLGMSKSVVAALYQALDVLLMPSMGEGFGIPLIEAQASGVPVIASDHSAMTELAAAGWLVGGDPWWDALQESFFIVPSIDGIVAALGAAYEARGDRRLRDGARDFALDYDVDVVTERFWEPALDRLAAGGGRKRKREEAAA